MERLAGTASSSALSRRGNTLRSLSSGNQSSTESSRRSRHSSTRTIAATATIGLVIEAMRTMVSRRIGALPSMASEPRASMCTSPRRLSSVTMPGTPPRSTCCAITSRMRARRASVKAVIVAVPCAGLPPSGALHESAVLIGGAEIDVDAGDPVTLEGEELGIAEFLAVAGAAEIGHEGRVAALDDALEHVLLDAQAVWPASLEIGGLVDAIVIRAGEAEALGKQGLQGAAILPPVGVEAAADDVGLAGSHAALLPELWNR